MQLLLWKKGPKRDQTGSFRSRPGKALFATFSQNKAHQNIPNAPIRVVGGGYCITPTHSCIIQHQSFTFLNT